jgi:hypothetical protein
MLRTAHQQSNFAVPRANSIRESMGRRVFDLAERPIWKEI